VTSAGHLVQPPAPSRPDFTADTGHSGPCPAGSRDGNSVASLGTWSSAEAPSGVNVFLNILSEFSLLKLAFMVPPHLKGI